MDSGQEIQLPCAIWDVSSACLCTGKEASLQLIPWRLLLHMLSLQHVLQFSLQTCVPTQGIVMALQIGLSRGDVIV